MKRALVAVGLILVVLVGGLLIAPAFIPVDTYKGQIEKAARDATGRDLKIQGDLSLSILPRLAVEAADVTFANAPGAQDPQMASIEKLAVQLQILPLISGEVKLDRLVLVRPKILLEVDKNGRANWVFDTAKADAEAKPEAPTEQQTASGSPAITEIALGEVRLEDGQLTYRDAQSGATYDLQDVDMDVSLPSLAGPFKADGGLTWNGERLSLNVAADTPRALIDGGKTSLDLRLESAPVSLTYVGSLEKTQRVQMGGAVSLDVPSIRDLASWTGNPIAMQGDGLGAFSIKGQLAATPSRFSFSNAEIELDGMKGGGGVLADVAGAKPYIKGELKLDVLDANKYMPPETTAEQKAGNGDGKKAQGPQEWSDEPIDLSGLKAVDADFDLSVEGILIRKIKIGRSALSVGLKNGAMTADLRELKLYNGDGKARLVLDGATAAPKVQSSFSLSGIDAAPFLSDAADFDRLSGTGTMEISVSTSGASQKAMVQALNGKGSVKFVDGAIRGINIAQMVRNVTTAFTQRGEAQKTDFAELSGTFDITKGLLQNKDLSLLNPLIRVTGAGTADLPKRTVNYRIEPKVVKSLEGQGGDLAAQGLAVPVIVEGPWHDLKYRPDLAAAIGSVAKDPKKALEGAKETVKGLGESLKGLTGKKSDGDSTTPQEGSSEGGIKPPEALKKLFGN